MKLIQLSLLIISLLFISQSSISQVTNTDKSIKVANETKSATHLESKEAPQEIYLHLETGVKKAETSKEPQKFTTEGLSLDEVNMYLNAFNAKLERLNESSANTKGNANLEKRDAYITELKSNIKKLEIKQKELQSK